MNEKIKVREIDKFAILRDQDLAPIMKDLKEIREMLTNGKAKAYNVMATDQAAYALVALWRLKSGLRGLYDMRPDLQQPLTVLLRQLLRVLVRAFSF